MNHRHQLFGVPVDALTMDETVDRCRRWIEARVPTQHVVLNASKVVMLEDDLRLREIVRDCRLVNADGMSIVWAGRLLGVPIPERVAGIDLMERLLDLAAAETWPVFFLGARPEILENFVLRVRERYPKLPIAGSRDGYFSDDEAVAREIASTGARLIFVGISSPRKEFFLARNMRHLGPSFAMGVGGSFDVWAGKTRRAPRWMRRTGLEWLHRLKSEPRRLWKRYLIGNARFVWIVCRAWWRTRGPWGRTGRT
jgi:N-acetylglucosaminyldiphosphoundecaprenol N-acetyl-beta-D-mannosaminyltransferase